MAEPDTAETVETDPEVEVEAGSGKSLIGRLKVAAFVLLVVTLECFLGYSFIPSQEESLVMAETAVGIAVEEELQAEAEEEADEETMPRLEVDLGEFHVASYQNADGTTVRIDFHLGGIVLSEDEGEFTELFESKGQRLKEQVLVTVRSAKPTDFSDPGLGLLRRMILEKINATFGKPILQAVIVTEFSHIVH